MMPRAKFHANPLKTVAVHTEKETDTHRLRKLQERAYHSRIRDVDQLKSSLVSYDFMAV